MPNLEGIGLQNFRTFGNKEILEFAPITLITGTNNAGKSSVFKAVQFLAHNFKDRVISETLDFKTMRHELGNLDRIFNRAAMSAFKNSITPKSQSMYARYSDYQKKNDTNPAELPIFEDSEDLVFTFPIKFGNSREISAALEFRYDLQRSGHKNGTNAQPVISHGIKSVAIVKDGEYLHWSNIFGYRDYYEESPDWEMKTSVALKKIIALILDTPFVEIKEEFTPNGKTEEYFSMDLYERIKKYGHSLPELPFFKRKKDGYEAFAEKLIVGRSLFSDYSQLTKSERVKILTLEQTIITELLQGKDNSHQNILECFKHSFSNILDGMEKDIVSAELKKREPDQKQKDSEKKNLRSIFKGLSLQTTPNSELFTSLLAAIEKDFTDIVQKKIDSLNKVYFLPTTRGRNREWFIDEQNSEDIQLAKDFSSLYLEDHSPIQTFINFWIGTGEITDPDENGKIKQKGFKIGKELSVFRDEAIGLTKIFLVNFDGTKTPLVDLGYGVSQLLPIIMKIAIIAQNHERIHEYNWNAEGYHEDQARYFSPSTLLIEEPEANLHPSLQSKMAELFIDAASRFNIQFLVETHSEYLIYKFQEYIGKKVISPDNVKMYYFNHPNDVREGLKDEYINQVKIGKDGSIDYDRYFGTGFFDEQNNLQLSLLNIRRNTFIEEYETIREDLVKSRKSLEGYDSEIQALNQQLSTATLDKNKLREQIDTVTNEKEEKELEFQQLIEQQVNIIDGYVAKADYSKYVTDIETIIDKNKIDNSKTLQYLSTGKFLLSNLEAGADFAPVIIQYGRALEFEMIKWMNGFKNSISSADKSLWSGNTNYSNKLNNIFSNLGIAKPSDVTIGFDLGTADEKKICFFHLKTFTNNSSTTYKFGDLTQIFELLYYISPANHSAYSYNSVPLMVAFSAYLKGLWARYDTAEGLFHSCRNILNLRNCAGHTYSDSVCVNDIINQSTAVAYVDKVEAIFKCL